MSPHVLAHKINKDIEAKVFVQERCYGAIELKVKDQTVRVVISGNSLASTDLDYFAVDFNGTTIRRYNMNEENKTDTFEDIISLNKLSNYPKINMRLVYKKRLKDVYYTENLILQANVLIDNFIHPVYIDYDITNGKADIKLSSKEGEINYSELEEKLKANIHNTLDNWQEDLIYKVIKECQKLEIQLMDMIEEEIKKQKEENNSESKNQKN